jgi:hypothetical protein
MDSPHQRKTGDPSVLSYFYRRYYLAKSLESYYGKHPTF